MKSTRREFVGGVISAAAFATWAQKAAANPLGLPLAIQLYSVREQMAQDLDMALAAVAAAGFVEVEAAALPKKSAKEIRASLDKAGLRCVSAHCSFADLATRLEEQFAFDAELGTKYVICSSPGHRTPPAAGSKAPQTFSLDDWRYNAERFNEFGEKAAKHDMQFGYHNHIHEFETVDGASPYEELLKLTDPKKVTFELDCGWARVAGHDPIELMRNHPYRFSMLHVKDFHLKEGAVAPGHEPKVTELGHGDIDYKPVIAAAKKNQRIRHAFVEQEAFDVPWQESLKIDADYMKKLT
ncbi:MAG TPA: sugar phosphate isomerase/epimerase [Acidobacteriaceae bacterium]|jgi:sugar phosphate isomerase/epimerase|nr:sugar phosphate isomerase/epimerase [Acidobacteriaceae bacterium]